MTFVKGICLYGITKLKLKPNRFHSRHPQSVDLYRKWRSLICENL